MEAQKVGPRKIIELKYQLNAGGPDGELLEIMDEQWPLKFLFGSGTMLAVFEENLSPLQEGDKFAFPITAADAYGAKENDRIVQVFKDEVEEDHRYPIDNYEEGDLINLTTTTREVAGKIAHVAKDYILVDCNHAMAGVDLYFQGQILHVRDAREDEVLQNRYIEPNGFSSGRLFGG